MEEKILINAYSRKMLTVDMSDEERIGAFYKAVIDKRTTRAISIFYLA